MSTFFMTALEAPVGSVDDCGAAGVDMVVVIDACRPVYDGGKERTMRRVCR